MNLSIESKEPHLAVVEPEDDFELFERSQAFIEKTFNLLSYTPWTSRFGGFARLLVGLIQLVHSTVLAIFTSINDAFIHHPKGYGYRSRKYLAYAHHSTGNILRGMVELSANSTVNTPRFTFFVPGIYISLFWIVYDQLINARMKYSAECKPWYIDPYVRAWQWIKSPQPTATTPPTAGSSRVTRRALVSSLPLH